MDLREIVQTLEAANPPEPKKPAEERPEDFKFNGALDKAGIPTEHPSYADRNCDTCYGRGVKRLVIVDGSVGTVFDDKTRFVNNPKRKLVACHCMGKGYARTRKRFEADFAGRKLVASTMERAGQGPVTDEEIRAGLRIAYGLA